MTRLADAGFESQVVTTSVITTGEADNGNISGTPTIDTSNPRSGLAALKFSTLNDTWQYGFTAVLDRAFFYRVCYRPSATPSATIISILQASNGATLNWRVNHTNAGKLQVSNSANEVVFTSAAAIPNAAYSRIEVKWIVPTAGKGTLELKLNGAVLFTSTEVNVANVAAAGVRTAAGTSIGGITFLIDDVAVNDDQGASQNSYPGEGKLIMLKPVSDNARVGWVNGASETTKLFDAVDNRPPTGVVVGSSTATSQIKDATNNATDTYDANLQSYAEAGILATDEIKMVKPLLRIGNSTTTQRNAAVAMVSNPVIAELAGLGSVSGTAATTDPAGWSSKAGTRAYSPAVTLGTQPVMRVRKATASTDVLTIDQMGLYVEYRVGLTLELSDGAAFSESHGAGDAKPLADAQALSDSKVLGAGKGLADALAATETRSLSPGVTRNDSFATSETRSLRPGIARADAITIADALTRAAALGSADAIVLTDTMARQVVAHLSRADAIAVLDALTLTWAAHRALTDAIASSDALTHQWAAHVALADAIASSDALTRALGRSLPLADSFSLVEQITIMAGDRMSLADSLALVDALTLTRAVTSQLDDQFTISDELERALAVKLAISDGFAAAESVEVVDVAGKRTGEAALREHSAQATILTEQTASATLDESSAGGTLG